MRSNAFIGLLAAGVAMTSWLAEPARAGDGFAVELFEPAPAQGRAILGLTTSHSLLQGELSVGLFAHFEDDPMTLVDPDDHSKVLERLVDERFTAELLGAVGALDWLELGVALPLVLTQSGADLAPIGEPAKSVGGVSLGDLRLIPKVTLLGGAEGFGLHLALVVTLPTGDQAELAGDGAVRLRPVLGADYATGRVRVAANVGYELRSERVAGSYVSDDMLRWGVGGRVALLPDLVALLATVQGAVQTASGRDPENPDRTLASAPTVSAEVMGGVELTFGGLVVSAGAGASFVHAVGAPDARAFVGVAWTTPGGASDADGDGVLGDDRCPDQAEDVDGFQDGDGCPDLDDDGDGVPDAADKCRREAEDVDGFQDDDGCPDPDNDGDGLADGVDKCPLEAEDKDGVDDGDGCPDLDGDGDGIADGADKCPAAAEDRDGFEDGDGCPDPDNDGDGVPDATDKCPTRAEVKNGVADDDGCPDTAEKDVEIGEREVKLKKKVVFPRDSAHIAAASFPLLDSVAKVLLENPYLTRVRVEGHTDSEGLDTVNLELSKQRAAAVVAYLVAKGVPASRLESEGYGESRPLVPNDTPQGRTTNRRVELKILEIDGKPLPE